MPWLCIFIISIFEVHFVLTKGELHTFKVCVAAQIIYGVTFAHKMHQ